MCGKAGVLAFIIVNARPGLGVAMVRALRVACEVAVYGFIILLAFWPRLPRAIGLPLAVVAFVAVCTHVAFRLHDINQARKDTSFRD
jgi:hypothetical protein